MRARILGALLAAFLCVMPALAQAQFQRQRTYPDRQSSDPELPKRQLQGLDGSTDYPFILSIPAIRKAIATGMGDDGAALIENLTVPTAPALIKRKGATAFYLFLQGRRSANNANEAGMIAIEDWGGYYQISSVMRHAGRADVYLTTEQDIAEGDDTMSTFLHSSFQHKTRSNVTGTYFLHRSSNQYILQIDTCSTEKFRGC